MTFAELANKICKQEVKESRNELNITQVREVLSKALKELQLMSVKEMDEFVGRGDE
jgi:hypothetical protein